MPGLSVPSVHHPVPGTPTPPPFSRSWGPVGEGSSLGLWPSCLLGPLCASFLPPLTLGRVAGQEAQSGREGTHSLRCPQAVSPVAPGLAHKVGCGLGLRGADASLLGEGRDGLTDPPHLWAHPSPGQLAPSLSSHGVRHRTEVPLTTLLPTTPVCAPRSSPGRRR